MSIIYNYNEPETSENNAYFIQNYGHPDTREKVIPAIFIVSIIIAVIVHFINL